MKASYLSIEPRWIKLIATIVVVGLSGCLSVNNHYSALDMSGPAGLVQQVSKPTSLLAVAGYVLLAAALGAGATWLLLRLRLQPMQTQARPTLVAHVNDEGVPDDEYRSEFQEPEPQSGTGTVSSTFRPMRQAEKVL
jgi:hypothetical protein